MGRPNEDQHRRRNVRDAILRAGTRLGWQMTPVSAGLVHDAIRMELLRA